MLSDYEISSDASRMDFERIHRWLTSSYWTPGISRERVEKGAAGSSLLLGAFLDGVQVAYLRVISDKTSFAWICDVIVDEDHRGRGIGKALVRAALADPEHKGLRRWVLATKDAHAIYASAGFEPLPEPGRWMIFKPVVGEL